MRLDPRELAAIFVGGFIGALARVALAEAWPAGPAHWPWATFVAIALPLLASDGLRGLALATLLVEGVNFAVRMFYLRRLFSAFRLVRHTARALLPSMPAVAIVFAVRLTLGEEGSLGAALALLALYVLVTIAATALLERRLLREIVAYLRRRPGVGATPA